MRTVYKVQTRDGVLHDNKAEALKHIEKRYGDLLLGIARELVQKNASYVQTAEFIDENLAKFIELADWKIDMGMEADDE